MTDEQQQAALSEQAQHFLDTAFKLALHDEFMGGPTAAERQRIEAIRAELAALLQRIAQLEQELSDATVWGQACDDMRADLERQLAGQHKGGRHYLTDATTIVADLVDENAALRAQLAEAGQWEPVPSGTFVQGKMSPKGEGIVCRRLHDQTELTTTEYDLDDDDNSGLRQLMVFIDGSYWLCRRRPRPGEGVE